MSPENNNASQSPQSSQSEAQACHLCNTLIAKNDEGYSQLDKSSNDPEGTRIFICQKCIICPKCGAQCQVAEIARTIQLNRQLCYHAKCEVITAKELDTDIELMNIGRLLMNPPPEVSRETIEQGIMIKFMGIGPLIDHERAFLIVCGAQALAAAGSLLISKNRREIEQHVNERTKKEQQRVDKERKENNKTHADKKAEKVEEKTNKYLKDKLGLSDELAKMINADAARFAKKDMLK